MRIINQPDAEKALSEAMTAIALSQKQGTGRQTLVVKGDISAIVREVQAKGLDGAVQIIPWEDGMTMKMIEDKTIDWLASMGVMSRENAQGAISETGRVQLLVPEGFNIEANFLLGVKNIDRYRVFLLVQSVLLAVEIRPDMLLRTGDLMKLARIVATQA